MVECVPVDLNVFTCHKKNFIFHNAQHEHVNTLVVQTCHGVVTNDVSFIVSPVTAEMRHHVTFWASKL